MRLVRRDAATEEGGEERQPRARARAASLPVKRIFDCARSLCDITEAEAPSFPTRASLPTIPEVHDDAVIASIATISPLSPPLILRLHPACVSAPLISLSLGTITQMLVPKKRERKKGKTNNSKTDLIPVRNTRFMSRGEAVYVGGGGASCPSPALNLL